MFEFSPISVVLLITTLINMITTYISWQRRDTKGGLYFALGMVGVTIWTMAAAFDYAATSIPVKVFFAKIEYFGYNIALALFAIFSVSYAGYDLWLKKIWVRISFLIIPVINILLAWTNDFHQMLWSEFAHNEFRGDIVIFYHGPAFLWVTITGYGMVSIIIYCLWQATRKGSELARRQARLLFAASIFLLSSNLIYLLDIPEIQGIDWTSITFSITGIIFLMALYGTRLLDLVPIARHKLIERMADGVIVLDSENRLLDYNPAAQNIFHFSSDQFGKPIDVETHDWDEISDLDPIKQNVSIQKVVEHRDSISVFDLRMTPLVGRFGQTYGKLIVFRNITKQFQTEEALRDSEERYRTVADYTYDWEYLQDPGGQIKYMSPSCERITGYGADEFIEKPELLESIVLPEDIEKLELHSSEAWLDNHKGDLHKVDFRILRRNGEMCWIAHTCQVIRLSDGTSLGLRATNRDVTYSKQAEELTNLRLELWEYAANYPLEELMQKALDKICALIGSPIGFYHFVEEDLKTLSLQAWSTRTLEEFCSAEGKGLHYDIDDAGVWVDAFHQEKPVIHNNYLTLPNRKGLPDGHAEVIRELVVPVIRDGRVVSILGVGNKPSDYNDKDIELVSSIADIVWAIVERTRTEEQIRDLNIQLERLAMTDELTGTFNRRSFFRLGDAEYERHSRYETPFAVMILDIDRFKYINDSFGHDAGDLALKCFVNTIQKNIRSNDILARLGGEEFGIILPNAEMEDAGLVAEKLRREIELCRCSVSEDQAVYLTVSIGVSAMDLTKASDFAALLKKADYVLYEAKNQGRNRVVLNLSS